VYIPSIDDHTLTEPGTHVLMAIGPNFDQWDRGDEAAYSLQKKAETERLLSVLEQRFPGITKAVGFTELATPATIERYTMKKGGAVAGPKQQIGQHMFKRLHTRSEWKNLFYCGESATMGTGTPAVSIAGLSAANAVLKKRRLQPFTYRSGMKNYVRIVPKPYLPENRYQDESPDKRSVMLAASRCLYCEHPSCADHDRFDVRGMNRRVTVGNFTGASRLVLNLPADMTEREAYLTQCEADCILLETEGHPVQIKNIAGFLLDRNLTQ